MLSSRVSQLRETWRDKLREMSLVDLIDYFGVRLMNSIDVAGRQRGQTSSSTVIAVDTSTELNYENLKKISNVVKYFAGQLLLADISLVKDITESHGDGPTTIVAASMTARHIEAGKTLADVNLTQVRELLAHYRRRRAELKKTA